MSILVTGGAGYIGSHTCVELLNHGHDVVVVDNLCNSSEKALQRVEQITGKKLTFYKIDLLDKKDLEGVFKREKLEAVIHFAALKAIGESVQIPLRYYYNNLTGTLHLCELMAEYNLNHLIFSSSAAVYGAPPAVPIREDFPIQPTNPYGWTKAMMERILMDTQAAHPEWGVVLLRYFNPVGAHPSGLIGEDPRGIPNNLMPYVSQVAVGRREKLEIFGDDYATPDGTGVRDYIHVVDLARGHLAALDKLDSKGGLWTYNLGTGQGYSVMEMIEAFEKVSGVQIPYKVVGRRAGDVAEVYADPGKANAELGWRTELGLDDMCRDLWRWQSNNPNGFID